MFRHNLITICVTLYFVVFATLAQAQLPQIQSGLNYLTLSQNPDGTWGNSSSFMESTGVTVSAIEALKALNQNAALAYVNATAWLQSQLGRKRANTRFAPTTGVILIATPN